jgi:hypothetical protein
MKHAGAVALDALEDVLVAIRAIPGLKEKKRGIFYRKSKSFLHFHEDPAGLFADVDLGADQRLPVNTPEEREALVARVEAALAESPTGARG